MSYSKIRITGNMEVVTGMHIGSSNAFAAIGAVDSSVIRDSKTNLPMVPGSSLKGKLRTLLAKQYNTEPAGKPDDDNERITRLFGSAKKGHIKRSRLIFSDMVLDNAEQLRNSGLQSLTEVKFENTINRNSARATPRQIERVVRGSVFALDLIYEVENEDDVIEDFKTLSSGLALLEYDYLGGNGTRGYGKVRFSDMLAEVVIGSLDDQIIEKCNSMLQIQAD